MKTTHQLTALIGREGDGYVSLCPELDIASQGSTIEDVRAAALLLPGAAFLPAVARVNFPKDSIPRDSNETADWVFYVRYRTEFLRPKI